MLKLKYFEAINMIAFFVGSGVKKVTIDFTDNKLVLIRGLNGTGKSHLIDALSPLTKVGLGYGVIENLEGKRILHYIDYDTNEEYRINHLYSPKGATHSAKSYITYTDKDCNTTELNPSGNISSFNDIIKEKFSLSNDNIHISKLTSKNTGIIDLTLKERMDFIYNILPYDSLELDKYTENIKDSLKINKRDLKALEVRIEGFKDIDSIDDMINRLVNYIKSTTDSIATLNKTLGTLEYTEDNYNDMKKIIEISNKSLNEIKELLLNLDDNDRVGLIYDKLQNTIIVINEDLRVLNEKKLNNLLMIKDIENEISNSSKYEKLQEDIERIQRNLNQFNTETLCTHSYTVNDIYFINRTIDIIIDTYTNIREYSRNHIHLLNNYKSIKDTLNEKINERDKCLKEKTDLEFSVKDQSMISVFQTLIDKGYKPECDCLLSHEYNSYMDNIEHNKNIFGRIDELNSILDNITNEIDELKNEVNLIPYILKIIETIDRIKDYSFPFIEINKDNIINNLISKNLSELIAITSILEKEIVKINNRDSYNSQRDKLKELQSIEISSANIDELNNTLISLRKDIATYDIKINEDNTILKDLVTKKDNIKKYYDTFANYSKRDLLDMKDSLEKDIENKIVKLKALADTENEIIEIKSNITNLTHIIEESSEEKLKLEIDKRNYESTITEYKRVKDTNSELSLLDEVLRQDIKRYLIDYFLIRVKNYTNEFLETSTNRYKVSNFILNENEFRIEIFNSSFITEDASLMSSGEKAILSLAFNIALQKATQSKYIFLRLDEVDATLDDFNRKIFIEALLSYLETVDTQVFIITHNNHFKEFDKSMYDIVAFNGAYEDSGNIIARI